ncbi:MAG TPA: histidine kinase dimerization/phosphoacceptor domain -containing protein [Ignavibacteriaceae bacterium]|nr:histidine kinase dimerization/phosphoacceptor domain -containing protein [Ignavibacteriaceae bacterium]
MKANKMNGNTKKRITARENELSEKLREIQLQVELQQEELKEKQNLLEESRDKFADLYDYAPNAYLTLDEAGLIKEINYTGANLLGFQKKFLIEIPFVSFLEKDEIGKFFNLLHKCKSANTGITEEFTLNSKEKGIITVHIIFSPYRNYRTKEYNIRLSLTDFTEKYKYQNELRESEARFRSMADSAPVMIWISDEDNDLIYANKTMLDFFGKSFAEINEKKWMQLIHPQDRERFIELFNKASSEARSFSTELRVKKSNNEYSWTLKSAVPLVLPGGEFKGFIGSEIDVSETKNYRIQLENSLKEKEVLLKEIHHRIKNNLQIISSLLNLQLNYLNNEEIIEMLKSSQSRIRSMALIHEKLYKTKELSSINFGEYIKELTSYLFTTYRNRSGTLRLDLDLAEVKIDINLSISLGLILNELVTNALKHAFPNRKSGTLNICLKEVNNDLFLIVADDGVGLPDGFDIKTTSSLGLELVDSLVDQHRGKLEINRNGKTEFRIIVRRGNEVVHNSTR